MNKYLISSGASIALFLDIMLGAMCLPSIEQSEAVCIFIILAVLIMLRLRQSGFQYSRFMHAACARNCIFDNSRNYSNISFFFFEWYYSNISNENICILLSLLLTNFLESEKPFIFVGKVSRTLSWWCFNPGIAMLEFAQLRVRSIILTSGTLSPLDSFALELKLYINLFLPAICSWFLLTALSFLIINSLVVTSENFQFVQKIPMLYHLIKSGLEWYLLVHLVALSIPLIGIVILQNTSKSLAMPLVCIVAYKELIFKKLISYGFVSRR